MKLLLLALNAMIDVTATRNMQVRLHPPPVIFAVLFILAMASALVAGYGMAGAKRRSWLHVIGFATVMALSVYVILDIEYPRLGLIRVGDQALAELLDSMK